MRQARAGAALLSTRARARRFGAQLNADSGVVSASNDALSQGQSPLATASSAINSVITTINSIQTALTQATEPGAELGNINTSLASLGQQLTDAVNAASFNGMNVLNGSLTALNFVSGFNAMATGGTVNTIAITAQALYGLTSGGTSTSTTSQSTVSDPTTMAQLQTQFAADTADTTAVTAGTVTASYGTDAIYEDDTNQALTVQSVALDGTATTTTYTALDANGNSIAQGGTPTFATAASYAVTTTVTTPASQNLLVQGGTDLTDINVTGASGAQAYARGRDEGLAEGRADAADRHAAELAAARLEAETDRLEFQRNEYAQLEGAIRSGLKEIEDNVGAVVTRILTPFLDKQVVKRAADELCKAIARLGAAGSPGLMTIRGPERVLALLRPRIADLPVKIASVDDKSAEVVVEAGATQVVTALRSWAKLLASLAD